MNDLSDFGVPFEKAKQLLFPESGNFRTGVSLTYCGSTGHHIIIIHHGIIIVIPPLNPLGPDPVPPDYIRIVNGLTIEKNKIGQTNFSRVEPFLIDRKVPRTDIEELRALIG
jgi:hypothetical protein